MPRLSFVDGLKMVLLESEGRAEPAACENFGLLQSSFISFEEISICFLD